MNVPMGWKSPKSPKYIIIFAFVRSSIVLRLRRILILNSCVLPISITFEIQMLSSVRNKEDQQRFKVSSLIYFFSNLVLRTFYQLFFCSCAWGGGEGDLGFMLPPGSSKCSKGCLKLFKDCLETSWWHLKNLPGSLKDWLQMKGESYEQTV